MLTAIENQYCTTYNEPGLTYDALGIPYDGLCVELPFNFIGIGSSETRLTEESRKRRQERVEISVSSTILDTNSHQQQDELMNNSSPDVVTLVEEYDPMVVEILEFSLLTKEEEGHDLLGLEILAELVSEELIATVSVTAEIVPRTKSIESTILTEHDPRVEDEQQVDLEAG